MSEQRVLILRKGFMAAAAVAALVLLASFHSIVRGAVERAAVQRLAAARGVKSDLAFGTVARQPQRANALFARVGN